jgi:hypothetical protein
MVGGDMRTYTWDEYYEKFYDWAESTKVRNLSALTSLGSVDEVAEIIIELQVNVPAANRLLKKAVESKLKFTGSDLVEFLSICDKELATKAVYNSAEKLSAEDMEDLYGFVDDEVIVEICNIRKFALPEDLHEEYEIIEEPETYEDNFEEKIYPQAKKLGFFTTLFAVLGAGALLNNNQPKQHNCRCNGDCANCPPHYGYRYGRWYYGHHHDHGCEFGGNKGL